MNNLNPLSSDADRILLLAKELSAAAHIMQKLFERIEHSGS